MAAKKAGMVEFLGFDFDAERVTASYQIRPPADPKEDDHRRRKDMMTHVLMSIVLSVVALASLAAAFLPWTLPETK